jgi:hydrogenase maturation protease
LGNPLRGDDGIGAAVITQLERMGLPPSVELLDGGTAGLETVLLMQGYERVIVVDAAEMGKPAGTIVRFTLDEVRLGTRDMYLRGTLHYAGLAEALALAEAMDMMPPELMVIGVQPHEIDWELALSDAVAAAVPSVCQAVLDLL